MSHKINLLFDARVLLTKMSGIYRVGENILKAMIEKNVFNISLYSNDEKKLKEYIKKRLVEANDIEIYSDKSDFKNIDAFFSPAFKIPSKIREYPKISNYIVIHDVIPLLFKEYFPDTKSWFYSLTKDIRREDYYFSNSECTKKDFLACFAEVNEKNVVTIPLAASEKFFPDSNTEKLKIVKQKYKIPIEKKYILSLCSLEIRKNLVMAIKSFFEFINKNNINDLVYVLSGNVWDSYKDILEKEINLHEKNKDKIIITGFVDDEDISSLYSGALFFVNTSVYEGFGLPTLEAMKSGAPTVVSGNSSLTEITGDSALIVNYKSEEEHVKAYENYYYNETLREKNTKLAVERANLFTWENCVSIISEKIKCDNDKKKNTPLVSIVTATYNLIKGGRKESFKKCVESVQNQTYKNIEHIIIDGASTDATLEMIKEYSDKKMLFCYSEPDNGIYFAMNKGIEKAGGKYIAFLNSDDYFTDENVVAYSVMKLEEHGADYSYGNAKQVFSDKSEYTWIGSMGGIFSGIAPCHQTLFTRADTAKELGGFNTNYRISADNDFMLRMFIKNKIGIHVNMFMIYFNMEGFSQNQNSKQKNDIIESFYNEYGQYHGISLYDCYNLDSYRCFKTLSKEDSITLGNKLGVREWRDNFFNKMIKTYKSSLLSGFSLKHIFSISSARNFIVVYILGLKISVKRKIK